MGHLKSNILVALVMFAIIGYIIDVNQGLPTFITSPMYLQECGSIGEIITPIFCTIIAFGGTIGVTIYTFKWWILMAILILRIVLYTSQRK